MCRPITVAAFLALAAGAIPRQASQPKATRLADSAASSVTIEHVSEGGKSRFEVRGLSDDELRWLRRLPARTAEQWSGLLAVRVVPGADRAAELPPILGRYRVETAALVFEPRFALQPGVRYRASFDRAQIGRPSADGGVAHAGKRLEIDIELALAGTRPPARVQAVYPSLDRLPENQLKLYIHFSAPMSRGEAYRHIRLLDATGGLVDAPFLELGEELWDPTQTRLTLLFDPGRIKRGLKPREEVGPAIEAGKAYTLVIDRAWPDANGRPIEAEHRKAFRVVAPDTIQPVPSTWKVHSPPAGSTDLITLDFGEPLDHAMLHRVVQIRGPAGETLEGVIGVSQQETRWQFKPAVPWQMGRHEIAINNLLEDLAGNSIRAAFEVDSTDPKRSVAGEWIVVPFVTRVTGSSK